MGKCAAASVLLSACRRKNVLFCRFDIISACCVLPAPPCSSACPSAIGCAVIRHLAGINRILFSTIRRIIWGLWPLFLFTNLTFPLPRSVFIVSRHSGYFIKGIASPKLPCELWSETDRAFQAVRPCSLEPAFFFNSYHLDRFGHSVLASLVSLQDISSVTIGLTSFKRFGFRHLFRKVSVGCRPGLWDRTFGFGCLPFPFLWPNNIINSAQRQAFFA